MRAFWLIQRQLYIKAPSRYMWLDRVGGVCCDTEIHFLFPSWWNHWSAFTLPEEDHFRLSGSKPRAARWQFIICSSLRVSTFCRSNDILLNGAPWSDPGADDMWVLLGPGRVNVRSDGWSSAKQGFISSHRWAQRHHNVCGNVRRDASWSTYLVASDALGLLNPPPF